MSEENKTVVKKGSTISFIFIVTIILGFLAGLTLGLYLGASKTGGIPLKELEQGVIYMKVAKIPTGLIYLKKNIDKDPRYYLLKGVKPSDLPEEFTVNKKGVDGNYLIIPYILRQIGSRGGLQKKKKKGGG